MAEARRRRPRRRAQSLVVDTTTTLDLPPTPVALTGADLWTSWTADPPFWWSAEDLPMAAMLCLATDATRQALTDPDVSAAGKAALLKEWRSVADQLGLTPVSRGRMKLTEGQAVVAAKRVEAMGAKEQPRADPIDLDDLLPDS